MASSSISSSPKPSCTSSDVATRLARLMNSSLAGSFSSARTAGSDSAIRLELCDPGRCPGGGTLQLRPPPPGGGDTFLDGPPHQTLGVGGRAPRAVRQLDGPGAQLSHLLTAGSPGQKGTHGHAHGQPYDQAPAEPTAPLVTVIIHSIDLHSRLSGK